MSTDVLAPSLAPDLETAASPKAEPSPLRLQFGLFLAMTAVLFLRPSEIELLPWLQDVPLFAILDAIAMAMCFPHLVRHLQPAHLRRHPVTACVLGLLAATVLSHLSHVRIGEAVEAGNAYFKAFAYFLLLVVLVDTTARLKTVMNALLCCVLLVSTLSVLQAGGHINAPAFAPEKELIEGASDPVTGKPVYLVRLCGAGIFHNSNDLSRIVVVGILITIWRLFEPGYKLPRALWLIPMAFLVFVLHGTHSRGGLLALAAGGMILFWLRYGAIKSMLLVGLLLPAALKVFSGRQLDFDAGSGTGLERIRLWAGGLTLFQDSPLFGIGMGRYAEEVGLVAHNSYMQCFTELGFFGGTLFVGAFALVAWLPLRLKPDEHETSDDALLRLRPFLVAITLATMVGMLTSTRSYDLPTYLILGMGAVQLHLLEREGLLRVPPLDQRLIFRFVMLGLVTLALFYVYVRLMVRWA